MTIPGLLPQPVIINVVDDGTHYHGLISYVAKDEPIGCSVAKDDLPKNPTDQQIGDMLINAGYHQYNDIKKIKIVSPKP